MIEQEQKLIEILLVEDNSTDALLTEEALASVKMVNHLHIVRDGIEALLFLRRQGKYANAPRPNMILLDLNLPVTPGCRVLAELKADKHLRHIPVIILSTSNQELDILRAYNLHANCYIVKPLSFHRFREIIEAIGRFWFKIATLPPL